MRPPHFGLAATWIIKGFQEQDLQDLACCKEAVHMLS